MADTSGPRKKALFVGINYVGTSGELGGCVNDCYRIIDLLQRHFHYHDENVRLLIDENTRRPEVKTGVQPHGLPNRQQILDGINWLFQGAQTGDLLYMHYSGHGTGVLDRNGDESDRQDEGICPLDYRENGEIIDDELRSLFLKLTPPGVTVRVVMDCCHSGTNLDLPYSINRLAAAEHEQRLSRRLKLTPKEEPLVVLRSFGSWLWDFLKSIWTPDDDGDDESDSDLYVKHEGNPASPMKELNVIALSGCRDDQTSDDASFGVDGRQGALTWALAQTLESWVLSNPGEQIPMVKMLGMIRRTLEDNGFTQKPELGCSRQFPADQMFDL